MLLKTDNICTNYGAVEAIRNINMYVEEGEVVAFIGHNGAGKTTLLKTISGLLRPVKGTVTWMGENITGRPPEKIVRAGISQCPEGRQVFAESTVYQNMEMGAYTRKDKQAIREDIEKYEEIFPILKERRSQKAGLLSGGEQQMLAIARSLMSRPKLLMLDEPSLGLAPVVVNDVYDVIQKIKQQGVTILLVEQNAMKALEVSDRAYVISTGEIALEGKSEELLQNDAVKKAYLGG
ncbi:ABC transporter ATP-binding protein [Christensenellaceae bacterium NSJ-63]|uniref:ABC transporter ATP-binding protein n=1 Tax=Guopingia tenuis TaxID=2763656 RepID=A0A926HXE3_9FIRM|nr:ABC transporter ATP-binding protein [Guopingia tenuis]MBC8539283.1 ABC transporter ATP-binding protein [Guopingia tenuis]